MTPALETVSMTVHYGGVVAVSDVDLRVEPGELVGLIGPNGAGKTSFIDAVCGFTPHRGRVLVGGVDVSGDPPHRRARTGLARTWQSVELFDDLSVRQNCEVAAGGSTAWSVFADVVRPRRRRGAPSADEVDAALEVVGLADDADRGVTELSHGRRKLVGVARALAASPSVILLDEPAAGLDSGESAELGAQLRRVVDTHGLGALLVDHDTDLVFDVCDRVYVLDFGVVIAAGTAADVRLDGAVIDAYLGVGGSAS